MIARLCHDCGGANGAHRGNCPNVPDEMPEPVGRSQRVRRAIRRNQALGLAAEDEETLLDQWADHQRDLERDKG